MGIKTMIMISIVAYRIYSSRNKPIKSVNFNSFLHRGGKVNEISFIK